MLGGRGDERVWPKAGRGASLSTLPSKSGASFLPLRLPPHLFPFPSVLLQPSRPFAFLIPVSLLALPQSPLKAHSLPAILCCTTYSPPKGAQTGDRAAQPATDARIATVQTPIHRPSAFLPACLPAFLRAIPSFVRPPRASCPPLGDSTAPISHHSTNNVKFNRQFLCRRQPPSSSTQKEIRSCLPALQRFSHQISFDGLHTRYPERTSRGPARHFARSSRPVRRSSPRAARVLQ